MQTFYVAERLSDADLFELVCAVFAIADVRC
jgi:hypothetical protein